MGLIKLYAKMSPSLKKKEYLSILFLSRCPDFNRAFTFRCVLTLKLLPAGYDCTIWYSLDQQGTESNRDFLHQGVISIIRQLAVNECTISPAHVQPFSFHATAASEKPVAALILSRGSWIPQTENKGVRGDFCGQTERET